MYDKKILTDNDFGYRTNPLKYKVVVHLSQVAAAEYFLNRCHQYNFKIFVGEHYLGGFVGTKEAGDKFVKSKVKDCFFGVVRLTLFVEKRYSHGVYTGLSKTLHY